MSKCKLKCEVWSRVCGYMRPVRNWNPGKREEFKDRTPYNENAEYSILDNERRYLASLKIPGGLKRLSEIKARRKKNIKIINFPVTAPKEIDVDTIKTGSDPS